MSWQPREKMELKRDFVELAAREGANLRELCRRFGISPPTGYKWLARFRELGLVGLEDLPRRPKLSPRQTSGDLEARVVAVRLAHPAWGGRKIRWWLENQGVTGVPAVSTVTEILRRHDLLKVPAGPSGTGWQRFERAAPNELWQLDFKGWFRILGGGRCYPLTMLDDHSRFNLLLEPCRGETLGEVRPLLERVFSTHGLPDAILCDNGSPWGDSAGHFTKFEAWLLRLGVKVYHGRPRHPQTQGKEERFHRSFGDEVLSPARTWRDLEHCGQVFKSWREIYNHERPHESLGGKVPANRFENSERIMPAQLPEAGQWYGEGDGVKKVNHRGAVLFKQVLWAVGEALNGEEVALRQIGEQRFEVYYCWKKLGVIDLSTRGEHAGGRHGVLIEKPSSRRIVKDPEASQETESVKDVSEQV